jgi:hypothetical protein
MARAAATTTSDGQPRARRCGRGERGLGRQGEGGLETEMRDERRMIYDAFGGED